MHVLRLFPPQEGKSLLIVAAEGGHELVLLTLLDGGADVNLVPEVCSRLLQVQVGYIIIPLSISRRHLAKLLCSLRLRMAIMKLLQFYWLTELTVIKLTR